MDMPVEKAKEILRAYKAHNYNASKALPTVGYTSDTATKASKPILNRALKAVAKESLYRIADSEDPMRDLFELVRVSKEDTLSEYVKILRQDKDLSTKLKALLPLLRELGLTWDETQVKVATPVLNITVSRPLEGLTEPKT
jgi:hypothetical protein